MLANLGYTTRAWNGAAATLVVIGRNALKKDATAAARLEGYVREWGPDRDLAHDPQWMARALGWRVCPQVSRRVFSLNSSPTQGIEPTTFATGREQHSDRCDPEYLVGTYVKGDERDESGPQASRTRGKGAGSYVLGNERDQPYAGWHWGNRGAVTSAAIEKPHRSGSPLLECEFDLAYTPLMELDYGKGRLIVCTLDLEDHVARGSGGAANGGAHHGLRASLSTVSAG